MAGGARADGAVRGVGGAPADVADAEGVQCGEVPAENVFDAPEAAGGEDGFLVGGRDGERGAGGGGGGDAHFGSVCEGGDETGEEGGDHARVGLGIEVMRKFGGD